MGSMLPVRGHRPAPSPVTCVRARAGFTGAHERDVTQLPSRCLGQKISILLWVLGRQSFLEFDMQNSVTLLNSSRRRTWKPEGEATLNQDEPGKPGVWLVTLEPSGGHVL